jgi:hypothetical protein
MYLYPCFCITNEPEQNKEELSITETKIEELYSATKQDRLKVG